MTTSRLHQLNFICSFSKYEAVLEDLRLETNLSEAFHRTINSSIGIKRNLWKLIEALQREETYSKVKWASGTRQELPAHMKTTRYRSYRQRRETLVKIVQGYKKDQGGMFINSLTTMYRDNFLID